MRFSRKTAEALSANYCHSSQFAVGPSTKRDFQHAGSRAAKCEDMGAVPFSSVLSSCDSEAKGGNGKIE